jgi:hypothetical protein
MATRHPQQAAPLPRGWTKQVKSALLHAISLVTMALTIARSRAAMSRSRSRRLKAERDRAQTEVALLKEELGIKDSRWSRLPSRRLWRP